MRDSQEEESTSYLYGTEINDIQRAERFLKIYEEECLEKHMQSRSISAAFVQGSAKVSLQLGQIEKEGKSSLGDKFHRSQQLHSRATVGCYQKCLPTRGRGAYTPGGTGTQKKWTSRGLDYSRWETKVPQVRRPGDWSCHYCKVLNLAGRQGGLKCCCLGEETACTVPATPHDTCRVAKGTSQGEI